MEKKFAYHLHSTHSDGKLTVNELIELAKSYEVTHLAICDHDTISGSKELMESENGMHCVSGIEITTRNLGNISFLEDDFPIHILGYEFDLYDKTLNDRLDGIGDFRTENKVYYQRLYEKASGNTDELKKSGKYFNDDDLRNGLQWLYTKDEITELIPKLKEEIKYNAISLKESIKLIKDAGGISILAHPYRVVDSKRRKLTKKEFWTVIDKLLEFGIDGIEVYYEDFSDEECEEMKQFCNRTGLMVYGGSDFHRNGMKFLCEKWNRSLSDE